MGLLDKAKDLLGKKPHSDEPHSDKSGPGPHGEPGGAAVDNQPDAPDQLGSDDMGLARHERPFGSETQSRDLGPHEAPGHEEGPGGRIGG